MILKRVRQLRSGPCDGQCTEASYASILGVELSEVPDLYTGDPSNPRCAKRWRTLRRYISDSHESVIMTCHFKARTLPLEASSLPRHVEDYLRGTLSWSAKYHTMMGMTTGGVPHMVVGYRGHQVWNPSTKPSSMLINVFGFELILNRNEVTNEVWEECIDTDGGIILLSGEEDMAIMCPYGSGGRLKDV